jgi:hypothetical protein
MIKSEPSTCHRHHNRGLRVMLREAHNNQSAPIISISQVIEAVHLAVTI